MPDVTCVEPFDMKKGLEKFLGHGFNLGLELGGGAGGAAIADPQVWSSTSSSRIDCSTP